MKKRADILLKRDGQSQPERFPRELDPGFAQPDSRSTEEYLKLTKDFARHVNYYSAEDNQASGDWAPFFEDAQAGGQQGQRTPPHLALFLSFLQNYRHAVDELNGVTGRHLDFYYKRVLGLRERPPVPDKAHVVIELKKQAGEAAIGAGTLYKAGKDVGGRELLYEQVEDLIANTGKVESLRSVYVDASGHGRVHMAPIANSTDGLGGAPGEEGPQWLPFGGTDLPVAGIGFALASPMFLLQEGVRKIDISLQLSGLPVQAYNKTLTRELFEAYFSGPEGWVGPWAVGIAPDAAGQTIHLTLELAAEDPALVAYDPALHGGGYASKQPLIQFFLNSGKNNQGYAEWKDAVLQKASISVSAEGVRNLSLENDGGILDPKKPFYPFGNDPARGSNFYIGYPEAFGKQLESFDLNLDWKDAPSSLPARYAAYETKVDSNEHFQVAVQVRDGGGWNRTDTLPLFNKVNASASRQLSFSKTKSEVTLARHFSRGRLYAGLKAQKTSWADRQYIRARLEFPWALQSAAAPRPGFISLQLTKGFLQGEFRELYPIRVMQQAKESTVDEKEIPKEPYTPQLQSVTLDYRAYSNQTDFGTATLESFANEEIQLFHIGAFGQMREHAYQKHRFESDTRVFLLPQYRQEGEFYIGLSGIRGGQGLSLLFQVVEGSADPETDPPTLTWQVLVDNYWRTLGSDELLSDTTGGLLTSGIIRFVLPLEATVTNSILPPGLVWLKCRAPEHTKGVCRLREVLANAALVQFLDRDNDPAHLSVPLPAGSISGFLARPEGVKGAAQPYASFGGAPAEHTRGFHTRVSERLRHKQRAVSIWDYERLLLEAFPEVYKVQCIPHASEKSFFAPGHVSLVLIPRLDNQHAADPLRPRVSNNTRKRAREFLESPDKALCSTFVELHVVNPDYEQVQLDFQVKFRPGFEFNFYSKKLKQEIREYLSPWAYGRGGEPGFGGTVYRSVLLDFVEERGYVDFVAEFRMYRHKMNAPDFTDREEVSATSPRSILVSHEEHIIQPYTG